MSGRSLGFPRDLWEVFQFKFLALKSLKRVWEVSGDLWKFLEGLREVSGRSLGSLLESAGKSLGGFSRRREVPGGFQKVLDSKSDATPSDNAKILPELVTFPCVFEGQNHFVL